MCNLYSDIPKASGLQLLFRFEQGTVGNLPPAYRIYPDTSARIVRVGPNGERVLANARWGMPTPPQFITGKADRGVTNVRNVGSPHWRQWLKTEHRCVVPATAFAEPTPAPDPATGKKGNVWFGRTGEEDLFAFAGIWTTWSGVRKVKDGPIIADLFGILTTQPNGVVAPIHPKAMPVILTTLEEVDIWLTAPIKDALQLQRPLPDDLLQIIEAPPEAAPEPSNDLFAKV